ncbi:hypothetical protein [Pseudomonas sp. RW10S2]|uniref:hypothetical protein n=1 Tax=Pseudomonas sp. RW10S2 TaxID=459637 RepID=UPI001644F86D|nr:hypothetical protein [Pseudomonas sp. RW10S2]MBC3466860.1 hypothetical protein [Pseudomonas sp. RW10S2]
MSPTIPQDYEQWRHCITVECGIALTPAFVRGRLSVWRLSEQEETRRFRRLYGDAHWRQIVDWFERAEREWDEDPRDGQPR